MQAVLTGPTPMYPSPNRFSSPAHQQVRFPSPFYAVLIADHYSQATVTQPETAPEAIGA